jgi:Family of unknown function (DUF6055)
VSPSRATIQGIFLKSSHKSAESASVSTLRRRLGRVAGLATVLGLLCAISASPAAARNFPFLDETMTSPHFVVHYTASFADTDDDPTTDNTFAQQSAGDLLVLAEKAYAGLAALGYPPPLDDGDGRMDVFVLDQPDGHFGYAAPDDVFAAQSSGWIVLDPEFATSVHPIAHEVYHLTQFAIWMGDQNWLAEATAEWAGLRLAGYPAYGLSMFQAPGVSVDCDGDICGEQAYEHGGYNRWVFLEYLSQRFGAGLVEELFERARDLGSSGAPTVPLEAALAARGTSLSAVFFDFARQQMTGGYTAVGLQGRQASPAVSVYTGTASATLEPESVVVNHLAARYVAFRPALEDKIVSTPCHAATLNVSVSVPAGIGAKPVWYWNGPGGTATELALSGSTASLSVPWYTCSTDYRGMLMLANPSVTTDAQEFVVSASIAVDRSRLTPVPSSPVTSKPPAVAVQGAVVPAPDSTLAPAIRLYGPELMNVSPTARRVTLVVYSSDSGKVEISVAGVSLGTYGVRAGYNKIRVNVPKAEVRRAAGARIRAGRLQLLVTAISPSGGRGMTVRQAVRVKRR